MIIEVKVVGLQCSFRAMLTIGACIVTGKIESYFQSKEKKRR
jgi:hypothetical protein